MKEYLQIVTIEQAEKLKELGFDLPADRYYEKDDGRIVFVPYNTENINSHIDFPVYISAPTVAFAIKWLRDEKDCNVIVNAAIMGNGKKMYDIDYFYGNIKDAHAGIYNTYEEAESAGLTDILDYLINHKK